MQCLEPSLLWYKTVLSVDWTVKTDLSSVPEEKTEETVQPVNQQPALTGQVGATGQPVYSSRFHSGTRFKA